MARKYSAHPKIIVGAIFVLIDMTPDLFNYNYFQFADAIMLVYNVEKPDSYEKIEMLKGEIAELSGRKPPIFIVQNNVLCTEEKVNNKERHGVDHLSNYCNFTY